MATARKPKAIPVVPPEPPVKDEPPASTDLAAMAMYHEKQQDWGAAAKKYEKLIRQYPNREIYYNRLMLVYRKLKDFTSELKTIHAGIAAFTTLYDISPEGVDKKIVQLSRQLSKLTGLTDNKGKNLYDPDPIGKWKRRKEAVMKKLEKK